MNPLLIRRRGMMQAAQGGLPAGYTLLQYISNPNDAYIQTDIVLDKNDTFELKYSVSNLTGSRFLFRSATYYNTGRSFSIGYAGAECYMNQYKRIFASRQGLTTLHYENNIYELLQTGAQYNASSEVYGTQLYPMTILAIDSSGTVSGFYKQPLYYFWVTGKIDLVPVISPNNEVGLYDFIGRRFFGSSNSNAFVAGPFA